MSNLLMYFEKETNFKMNPKQVVNKIDYYINGLYIQTEITLD